MIADQVTGRRTRRQSWPQSPADILILLGAGICLAYLLYQSLHWRYRQDTGLMIFFVSLNERYGMLPWRDWFDMNMPGAYVIYRGLVAAFGYSPLGIRIADFLWMASVTGVTLVALRGVAWRVRALGLMTFLFEYLHDAGNLTLQREMLGLLPVSLGLWAALSRLSTSRRSLFVGLAFGAAATVKPHLALGLAPTLAWLVAGQGEKLTLRQRISQMAQAACGLAIPIGIAVAIMAALGILGDFFRMLPYLGLYSQVGGDFRSRLGWNRLRYIAQSEFSFDFGIGLLFASLAGLAAGLLSCNRQERRPLALLSALLGTYWLYPATSGQFYAYHWLPLKFFASLLVGWLIHPAISRTNFAQWFYRLIAILLLIQISGAAQGFWEVKDRENFHPAEGRVDEIGGWLATHMQRGDTVQPFDWVGGGVAQAMLTAHARPATRYVYAFHFFHHVSTPYIRALRKDFIRSLYVARPVWIVESRFRWPYVTGPDTSKKFFLYEKWRDGEYVVVREGESFQIWERKDRALADQLMWPRLHM